MPVSDKHKELYDASLKGDEARVAQLLEDGVEPDTYKDDDDYTALQRAAEKGFNEIVSKLINARADFNIQNYFGNTALHWAAFHEHNDVTSTLLEAGADLNIQNKDGKSCLHFAAEKSQEIVVRLLEAGADPYLQNNEGKTPIDVATNEEIARF